MFFVSQLIKADIMDSADNEVGKVLDLICRPDGDRFPPIIAVVCKTGKEIKAFSYENVENVGKGEVSLNVQGEKVKPYEIKKDDLFVARDILDKQIVDLEGTRVVRVNDLRIGFVGGELRILGIDVSTRGILRRMGLDHFPPFSWFKSTFIDWEMIQIIGKSLKLSKISQELVKLHPADLANIVENLNPYESNRLIQALEPRMVAKVFEELEPHTKQKILKSLEEGKLADILTHIPVDELVDYLKTLKNADRKKIISSLGSRKKKTVQQFLFYEDDTAGGLMTTEFIKVGPDWTIAEARESVRESSETMRTINFVYIINDQGEIVGVVSMRSLIVYPPSQKLRKIMKRIRSHQTVHVGADVDHIAKIMTRYNLNSVAIVDDGNKFLGIVTVDDILRRFVPNA